MAQVLFISSAASRIIRGQHILKKHFLYQIMGFLSNYKLNPWHFTSGCYKTVEKSEKRSCFKGNEEQVKCVPM